MKEERTNGWNVRMRIRKYAFLMAAAIVIALLIVAQVKLFPTHLNAEESVIFILLAGYACFGVNYYRKHRKKLTAGALSSTKLSPIIAGCIIFMAAAPRVYLLSHLSVRHGGKFCVSEIRQKSRMALRSRADFGDIPLATSFPEVCRGMRAAGVNAVVRFWKP